MGTMDAGAGQRVLGLKKINEIRNLSVCTKVARNAAITNSFAYGHDHQTFFFFFFFFSANQNRPGKPG